MENGYFRKGENKPDRDGSPAPLTLITLAPLCANMIQTLVHTCRCLGCSIFIEINVKRQSNPSPFKVFNIQHCSAHIQPSTIILKNHFKKCVPFRHNSQGN